MALCVTGDRCEPRTTLSSVLLSVCCCVWLQVDWAVSAHERMLQGAHAFFQQHDLLLCPTVMLQPFDASIE